MKSWIDTIIPFFAEMEYQEKLPFSTPFRGIWFANHKVCFHFISIDVAILNKCEPTFFKQCSKLSDQHKVKCIHVWEDVFKRNPHLVTQRLLAMLKQRERIHARETIAKRIHKPEAHTFLMQHHLQGDAAAYYKYGLYWRNQLVAVATFSKSRVMNDGVVPYRSYEWVRFASIAGTTVIGGLSKLFQCFINDVNPAHVMTYADRDWGDGMGYVKLGFIPTEEMHPQAFFINCNIMERFYQNEKTNSGLLKIYNSGNIKYVLDRRSYTS